ncbi:MAG: N-acetylneuraminate synthase family protein [Elusimicrobia bacterium]|nr:N-acetylneuraminate synthase family protein [Elusimicrobiota bacterium]
MRKIKIGDRRVGDGEPTFVIAEAGSNHDKKFDQALKLIDVAAQAGADAVKFQVFRAQTLYPKTEESPEYLKSLGVSRSIYRVIEDMEMPFDWIPRIAEACADKKILFLATAFDEECLDRLDPFVAAHKIASYEMNHIPLVRHAARKGKPLMVSTGGATFEEVHKTVEAVLAAGNPDLCVMQCTAKYPAPPESMNLRVLTAFREHWGLPVGLSDHSRDPVAAPVAAVAMGASVIEKHFTLSNRLPGPDHSFAVEPAELKDMVQRIRWVEKALGLGQKAPHAAEQELREYRRGVFTVRPVAAGELLTDGNTAVLRRGGLKETDLAPENYPGILGKKARRDLPAYALLGFDDVER